jgi:hypothetical protein
LFAHKKHFELQSKYRELIVPNLFYIETVSKDKRDYVPSIFPFISKLINIPVGGKRIFMAHPN